MNCPNCGDFVPGVCEFCPKCGTTLASVSIQKEETAEQVVIRREVPWWVSVWRPEITIRPNAPEKFIELYLHRKGATVRTVTSRERWVNGTFVLFSIIAGTLVLIAAPFLYYHALTGFALGLVLLGLLVFSPRIWFQLWPFWLAKNETVSKGLDSAARRNP